MFWEFYLRKDSESVYKILFNYFKSLSVLLNEDWLNPKSLLNKTTGYNAIMKLFKDVYTEGIDKGTLKYDFFFKRLEGLSSMNGTITSENYGASGFKASNELYTEMKKTLANMH